MHFLLRIPYAALGALAETAAAVVPAGDSKWQKSLRARRGLFARVRAFAAQRDPARPLVWFHAPSVGEALQALPVVQRARAAPSPPQLALTWYSPSVEAFAQRFDVDFRDYLPFDTAAGAREMLDALKPAALVYSKLDVWPVLSAAAADRGVRVGLISATLSEGSSRRSAVAKAVLRDAYRRLDFVGAITESDGERLVDLGVRREVLRVTGDTRFDQVWERAQRLDRTASPLGQLRSARPTLVAGSTWPPDEAALMAAWEQVLRAHADARLIIAPHEPTPAHIEPLRAWARRQGLAFALLSEAAASAAGVVVVDRVGILADAYSLGSIAYVGGGFHSFGLHSVLEPAAFGVPVVHGPAWRDSPDAGRLLAARGGRAVASSAELAEALRAWFSDTAATRAAGVAAEAFVRSNLGAADRALGLVNELVVRG